jgi:hypothetical protein
MSSYVSSSYSPEVPKLIKELINLDSLDQTNIDMACENYFKKTHETLLYNRKRSNYKKIQKDDCGSCSICITQFNCNNDSSNCYGLFKRTLKCGHTFHKKCIDKWLLCSPSCPECRMIV